jgi:aminopeptidase N
LRNICLGWLVATDTADARALALRQYHEADNMTDAQAALAALNVGDSPQRHEALAHFRNRWRQEPLILDKWLALQASTRGPGSVETVESLLLDPSFDLRNPNRIRALLGSFAHRNLYGFHRADGAGYALVAGQIQALDRLNPQVAARLASAFSRWRRFDAVRRGLMQDKLERLSKVSELSADVAEIVSKSLESG